MTNTHQYNHIPVAVKYSSTVVDCRSKLPGGGLAGVGGLLLASVNCGSSCGYNSGDRGRAGSNKHNHIVNDRFN